MCDHAREKAAILWKKRKEIEEQNIAEEKRKEQELKQQLEAKWKQHKEAERLHQEKENKQQLREKYIKQMEAEKEEHELKVIEEKYGNELLQQVRKDMSLPKDPVPKIVPALIGNPHASEHDTPSPSFRPSALLSKVKMEKYSISKLA